MSERSERTNERLSFTLAPELEAQAPPEARGLTRDGVRMLVAHRSSGDLTSSTFTQFPTFLDPGDLVVINTSATLPAAVDGLARDGTRLVLHLSTQIGPQRWVVEPRQPAGAVSERWSGPPPPHTIALGEGATVHLVGPHLGSDRLWVAELSLPGPALTWLAEHGRPIRYGPVVAPRPLSDYQNTYATEPGSAEMASAGRPFTPEIITKLVSRGVGVTPLVLHTGVASLEADEIPYPEGLVVPSFTASRVNATHHDGGRVVAVGTTVVRALEAAAEHDGTVRPLDGWTDLVITPERGVRTVDGLLSGWHEPEASHLLMLEAVAGRELLERSYAAALDERYLWHEFGDVHLVLP